MSDHLYETSLAWEGSTGAGYRAYTRTHRVGAPPAATELTLSADPHFRGDATLLNPEQLLVAAASSCQLLAFLAEAARAGVDVTGYTDTARGVMTDRAVSTDGTDPMSLDLIELAPVIRVAAGTDPDLVHRLVEAAHHGCYIANSLLTKVTVAATVELS